MTNKKIWFGIVAMTLLFGLFLTRCGDVTIDNSYTFEFKVQSRSSKSITKIEFINGSSRNERVLRTETISLSTNEMSRAFKVLGFTEEHGDAQRLFGINVTFDDETTLFNWGTAGHENKIFVTVWNNWISFSAENW